MTDKGRALDQRMNDFQIQKLYHYFDLSGDLEGKNWNRIMQLYANEVGKKYLDLMPDDYKKDDEA